MLAIVPIPQKYIDSATYLLSNGMLSQLKQLPYVGYRHTDAAITSVFARQLEVIEAQIEREEFPPLKSATYIPYVSEGGDWAESITHRQITDYGVAKWVTERATDIPMVGVSASEATRTIGNFADGWRYTHWDIARAAYLSISVDTEKARIARDGILRFHNNVAAIGDSALGYTGLANATVITDGNAALSNAADKFDSDDPIEIVTGLSRFINKIEQDTKENHRANTCLMPIRHLQVLATRPYGAAENPTAILDVLKTRHPGVTFDSWEALADVGAGGLDRIIAYDKNPGVVKYHAPVVFKQMPPFLKDAWTIETVGYGRSGLTEIRRPKAIIAADLEDLSA